MGRRRPGRPRGTQPPARPAALRRRGLAATAHRRRPQPAPRAGRPGARHRWRRGRRAGPARARPPAARPRVRLPLAEGHERRRAAARGAPGPRHLGAVGDRAAGDAHRPARRRAGAARPGGQRGAGAAHRARRARQPLAPRGADRRPRGQRHRARALHHDPGQAPQGHAARRRLAGRHAAALHPREDGPARRREGPRPVDRLAAGVARRHRAPLGRQRHDLAPRGRGGGHRPRAGARGHRQGRPAAAHALRGGAPEGRRRRAAAGRASCWWSTPTTRR